MIKKLRYFVTQETNPYRNIALEEYLLRHLEPETCTLYLWQNRKTVVIGRNQNAWKECNVEELERDGGFLARRLSGGGAVFHDMGNLNFTFLVSDRDYDVDRQLSVLLCACRRLGIQAEKTGRNDVTVERKKFSGNAFYRTEGCCYHHGTLMIHVDLGKVSRYLNVSPEKLRTKGVDSVKSRVANLDEFCPGLTVEKMREKVLEGFQEVYGREAWELSKEEMDAIALEELEERERFFAHPSWKYGKHFPFTFENSRRFSWGEADLRLEVKEGIVAAASLFSDGMDEEFPPAVGKALAGCPFRAGEMRERLLGIDGGRGERRQMAEDVAKLLADR